MPQYPGFVGAAYTGQSYLSDCERLINWYVEPPETTVAKATLYPAPGYATLVAAAESPGRGIFAQDGRCFPAIGQTYYELNAALILTARGTIARDTNPAQICSSGDAGRENFIASGSKTYVFDLNTNAFAEVLIPGITNPTHCGYLDGRFIVLDTATSTIYISATLDGTTWSALDILQRSDAPDRWIAMGVSPKEIWLFGSETTSVLYNAGTFPFPFAPIPNVLIEQGIAAPFALARVAIRGGNAWMWLARDRGGARTVMMANGYAAVRISTFAIDFALQGYATISDAYADTYQANGHNFFVLNFPTAGVTWVYDATTGLWAERGYWNTTTGSWEASRAQYHAYAFDRHIVLDRGTGTVHGQSETVYTDVLGAPLRRVRRAPHLYDSDGRKLVFYQSFELEMDLGVGLASGQGEDPQVMLRMSQNAGKTWGRERWRSAGKMGKYNTRVRWDVLPSARDAVFEIAVSDPVPFMITDAYVDYALGTH